MELRTLEYFLVVAQEENISRAANVLHITQPTLSRQMKNLEEELDAKLFIRGKNFELTSAGLLLRERAEEILTLTEKTKNDFERVNEMIGGTITIGSAVIGDKSLLSDLMVEFCNQYPKVSFELITGTGPEVTEQIDKGLIDLGLLIEPITYEKYDFKRLSHVEKWGVITHKDSPLAEKESVTAKDLLNLTVGYSNRKEVQRLLSKHLEFDITQLDTLVTFNLISNVIGLAEKNQAHLLTLVSVINEGDENEITYRLFEPELSTTMAFVWKKGKTFNDPTLKFIQFLKEKKL